MCALSHARETIRIGTRSSSLARWQANWVAEQLCKNDPELSVDLVEIKTEGDHDRSTPLAAIGGTGLFTKAIQRAVCAGEVDIAVHSLKDLPTKELAELVIPAVPERADVFDVLVAPTYRTIDRLPEGAQVGTSSPRRRAQLLFVRPDLKVVTIRGNVETRLNQAMSGRFDAVVLAGAGLKRLGLDQFITQQLEPSDFLPAPGQGALGIECRRGDKAIIARLELLDEPASHRAVIAERATLGALEGGCSFPIAVWARDSEDDKASSADQSLVISAAVLEPDGRARVAITLRGERDKPTELGRNAAQALRDEGEDLLPMKAP
jgi:hydroxymethylbilane synthase